MPLVFPILRISASVVGQAILPAAASTGGSSDDVRVFALRKRRLKAGGSQDWLPHYLRRLSIRLPLNPSSDCL
jgi:hypothetical protein